MPAAKVTLIVRLMAIFSEKPQYIIASGRHSFFGYLANSSE